MINEKDPAVLAQFAYTVAEAAWDYIDTLTIIYVQERFGQFNASTQTLNSLQKAWSQWRQDRFTPEGCARLKAESKKMMECSHVKAWADNLFKDAGWYFERMHKDNIKLVKIAVKATCLVFASIIFSLLAENSRKMFPAWYYSWLPTILRAYTIGCNQPDQYEQASELFMAIIDSTEGHSL